MIYQDHQFKSYFMLYQGCLTNFTDLFKNIRAATVTQGFSGRHPPLQIPASRTVTLGVGPELSVGVCAFGVVLLPLGVVLTLGDLDFIAPAFCKIERCALPRGVYAFGVSPVDVVLADGTFGVGDSFRLKIDLEDASVFAAVGDA